MSPSTRLEPVQAGPTALPPTMPAGSGPSPSAKPALSALAGHRSEDDLFRDPFADFAPSGR